MTSSDRLATFTQFLSRNWVNTPRDTQELRPPIFVGQCSECEEIQSIGEQADDFDTLPCASCGSDSPILRYRLKIDALESIPRGASDMNKRRLVKPISDRQIIKNFTHAPREASPTKESWDVIPKKAFRKNVRHPQRRDHNHQGRTKIFSEILGSATALAVGTAICGGIIFAALSGNSEAAKSHGDQEPGATADHQAEDAARTSFIAFASAKSLNKKARYISNSQLYLKEISKWYSQESTALSLNHKLSESAIVEKPAQDGITLLSITKPIGYPRNVYFTDGGLDWPSFIQADQDTFSQFLDDPKSKPAIFRLSVTRSNRESASPFEIPFLAKDLQPDSGAQVALSGALQIASIREIINIPTGASRIATLELKWDHSTNEPSIVLENFIGWGLQDATISDPVFASTLPVN